MLLKKFIVCTSINKPTLAIKKFDSMKDWKLIVVGDKKTPRNYKLKNGIYLSPTKQEKIDRPKFLELAKDILDAKGYFNDDEDKLYNVFKTIQTQFQLSLLSRVFSTYYKKDLLEYLKSILNADEIAPILKQVQNYPQYLK